MELSGLIYASLFGIGHLVFGRVGLGVGLLVAAGIAAVMISRNLDRDSWRGASPDAAAS